MIFLELVSAGIFAWAPSTPPPARCSRPALADLVNRREYAGAVERSHLCLAATKDPYFHFAAAQAYHFAGDHASAEKELKAYNRKAKVSDPDHDSAAALLVRVRAALADAPLKPSLTTPPSKPTTRKARILKPRDPATPPVETSPSLPMSEPAMKPTLPPPESPAPVPETTLAGSTEVGGSRSEKENAPHRTVANAPPEVEWTPPASDPPGSRPVDSGSADSRPKFRRGWIGLGIGAGAAGIVAVALGLPGGIVARNAFQTNETALKAAGLTEEFKYGNCAISWSVECKAADTVERDVYSTASYHQDLALASRLQSAAVLVGGVALGGLVGALPIRLRDQHRRRSAIAGVFGGGLLVTAGAAVVFAVTRNRLGESLEGLDAQGHGHAWRTSQDDFGRYQGKSLGSAAFLGLGAGTAISSGIAWLAERRARKAGDMQAGIRVTPTLGGFLVVGLF